MAGRAKRGFVPIAGLHHAGRAHAAGFCVFNDIGVVVEQLKHDSGSRASRTSTSMRTMRTASSMRSRMTRR